MKFDKTEVWGFEHALRGMRNPMNSGNKSDSDWAFVEDESLINPNDEVKFLIGRNDMKLAQKLIRAGSEHRKFMRQIFVSVDITAPLYWWSEVDTYKVGTTANSTSKMHKLAGTPITKECFELDDYNGSLKVCSGDKMSVDAFVEGFIDKLEGFRLKYLETKDKRYWKELIRWLPESWLQTRTITMNYENIFNIVHQRKNHKLNEWSGKDNPDCPNFIAWARTLPYAQELIFLDETEGN